MQPSQGARTAARGLRITAGVLGVLLIGLSVPFAITSILSNDPDQSVHRFHLTGGAISSLILAAALLLLAWRPGAVAALQLFVVGAIMSVLVGLVSGDVFAGLYFIGVVVAAILLALHPARAEVWRVARPRLTLLVAAVVSAVPAVAYAFTQARLQRQGSAVDPHVQMHHYSGMAVSAVALPATALVAAIGGAGWRVVGWIAGGAFVAFGLAGIAFSAYVSAPGVAWSWASVAVGVIVLALTEVEARGRVDVDTST